MKPSMKVMTMDRHDNNFINEEHHIHDLSKAKMIIATSRGNLTVLRNIKT